MKRHRENTIWRQRTRWCIYKPRNTKDCWLHWKLTEVRKDAPLQVSMSRLADILFLDFWPLGLWNNTFTLFCATQFWVLHYSTLGTYYIKHKPSISITQDLVRDRNHPTEAETLGVDIHNLCVNKPQGDSDVCNLHNHCCMANRLCNDHHSIEYGSFNSWKYGEGHLQFCECGQNSVDVKIKF